MATITLKGNTINTIGQLPQIGTQAPDFTLVKNDLSKSSLSDYKGSNVILNIFPSIDTGTCAASVRQFNEEAKYFVYQEIYLLPRRDSVVPKELKM